MNKFILVTKRPQVHSPSPDEFWKRLPVLLSLCLKPLLSCHKPPHVREVLILNKNLKFCNVQKAAGFKCTFKLAMGRLLRGFTDRPTGQCLSEAYLNLGGPICTMLSVLPSPASPGSLTSAAITLRMGVDLAECLASTPRLLPGSREDGASSLIPSPSLKDSFIQALLQEPQNLVLGIFKLLCNGFQRS